MKPLVAVITLGVKDLERARRFYSEGLGWPSQQEDYNWVCFLLGDGSSALALHPWDELAEDATVSADGDGSAVSRSRTPSARRGASRRCSPRRSAPAAGSSSPRNPTSWGGYGGYFADPEGYLWEVATGATQLPFSE